MDGSANPIGCGRRLVAQLNSLSEAKDLSLSPPSSLPPSLPPPPATSLHTLTLATWAIRLLCPNQIRPGEEERQCCTPQGLSLKPTPTSPSQVRLRVHTHLKCSYGTNTDVTVLKVKVKDDSVVMPAGSQQHERFMTQSRPVAGSARSPACTHRTCHTHTYNS